MAHNSKNRYSKRRYSKRRCSKRRYSKRRFSKKVYKRNKKYTLKGGSAPLPQPVPQPEPELLAPFNISPQRPVSEQAIDERSERVKKRAQNPKDLIINFLRKENFDSDIEMHNRNTKIMCENAYETYIGFKNRLEKEGSGASFPELGGCVKFLIKALYQSDIYTWFEETDNTILIEQVTHKILGLMIEGRFNFPYVDTIYVIENLLELIDYYYRKTDLKDDTVTVNERIGPYYHVFRYRSYISTFLNSEHGIPNNIIFPTCANIGATDLIKIRCAPILIMGVVNEPVYVDQYINTPLDFWAHDIQHAKRQIQETLRYYDVFIKHNNYYKRRTLYDLKTLDEFYKYMQDFTKDKIIPMITLKGTIKNTGDEKIERERAFRAIKKLIIFEVVHEKAWPITQPSLCRNISLRYDEFPVENITLGESDINTGEKVIKAFHYLFADPTTIANVIGKLRTGFYDKTSNPQDYVVPVKYRTSLNVSICAKEIMKNLGCSKIPTDDYFLALATDRHAMQEFKDIPTIPGDDEPNIPIEYPKLPQDISYSDIDLYTTFMPSVDIDDISGQDSLHKKETVDGYDPNIFENSI